MQKVLKLIMDWRVPVFCLILLLSIACNTLTAQEIVFEHFETGVDFWVLLPFNSLNFAKGSPASEYQLSIVIRDSRKKQMADFERSVIIPNAAWLRDTSIPVRFSKVLVPGTYTAEFKLKNKILGEKRSFRKSFEINSSYTEIGQSWLLAYRDGVSFIPNSITGLEKQATKIDLSLSYSVTLDSIKISTSNHVMHFSQPKSPLQIDLTPFIPDMQHNVLKLALFEKNIHYYVEPFLITPWYSYSLLYNLEDQMNQLRYIASQNEWQALRSVPEDKYLTAIESFWKVNDPSPGTVRNENRERFYQRVVRADELFTVHKKLKGWNSDRGRIYIKYGEPDEIVSESYPLGRYPNIIWTYYQQDREFIFADTKGFGLYTLRNKEDEY